MKTKTTKLQKLLAMFLAVAVIIAAVPLSVAADSLASPYKKVSDSSTLDGWKEFFGSQQKNPTTENAGGIWTDKSVFADNSSFQNLTDAYGDEILPVVADDSFLVALSAIASNKSIVGYSHIPTDTVLLLDISGSMGPDHNNAVSDLVLAANAAMTELLALNNNNRVGVVLYSAEYDDGNDEHYYTLLPIDRYSATGTVTYNNGTRFDTSDDITVGKYLETNAGNQHNGNEISIASGVSGNNGAIRETTIDVVGGTFIQGGLKAAADAFKVIADNNDTVIEDGFQAGTQRKPVLVLMSDGAPTYATTSFTAPADPNLGRGSSTNETYAFLTQLTAAYVKQQISSYYNDSEALFYTLGLGVGNSAEAQSVLDPANSTNTIKGYWENYAAATNGATVEIANNVSVTKTDAVSDIVYANRYFEADSRGDLFESFKEIVNEIIIQSLYRPTLVEENNVHQEGYIEFIDDIGDYMKVEQIEGVMIGDKLYTGEKLCENFRADGGELGTVENPNALGDNLIWSVKSRLGIDSTEEARSLVANAYNAGQLSYTNTNSYSNFIGWYADENGNYIGFWDETDTYSDVPQNAKYINKSYGMLGEISDGLNESDLMYVSIQVHTEIASQGEVNALDSDTIVAGHSQLIFRVPASLIPVVTYDVELEGTSYDDAQNAQMTIKDAEPIRLLFEVGLRDDINEFNIASVVSNKYRTSDGKYELYTNEWSVEQFDVNNEQYLIPTKAINTIAYFEPSYENERYYYSEPTPIYVYDAAQDEYVEYVSATKPQAGDGNEYYRQINVFELTPATNDGNAAVHKKLYERISDKALGRVDDTRRDDGGWEIMKETIHRVYDEVETKKAEGANKTETLEYSYFPTVEHIEGTHYYADAILGNNGKLTVTPATGIKITKQVDSTLVGTNEQFTFNVRVNGASGEYALVREAADGTLNPPESITFTGGEAQLPLAAGESAYILDLPLDATYTVTEQTSGKNYVVKSVNGDESATSATGTITQYILGEAEFVNTLRADGYLVISKEVIHPFAQDPEALKTKKFDFEITLSYEGTTANYPVNEVSAWYSSDSGTEKKLAVDNNKIGLQLSDNQSVMIKLAEGWTADVVERIDPSVLKGFSGDEQKSELATGGKVITDDKNVVYNFVNRYEPSAVSPNIHLDLTKKLEGRPWLVDDEFTFTIARYNPETAQYSLLDGGSEKVYKNGDSDTMSFGDTLEAALANEIYTKVGTYRYLITEKEESIGGITYDTDYRIFDVIVSDNDMDGTLDYTVAENERVTVTKLTNANADWHVGAQFKNSYKADGVAEIRIEINKTVTAPSGIDYSPAGFEFGVYNKATGDLVSPLYKTDENGIASFVFTYNANGVDWQNNKVIQYVIKETDTGLGGITYANDIDFTVTVKDNLDGTIKAETSVGATNGVSVVTVENIYTPSKASAVVEGSKEYVDFTGAQMELQGDEFEFTLSEADDQFSVVQGGTVYTDRNDQDGKFSFNLEFDKIGEYKFVLAETKGQDAHIEYDDTVYNVTISVTDNSSGQLQSAVKLAKPNASADEAVFTNTYTPDPEAVSVEFNVEKTVENKGSEKIGPEGFKFVLSDKEGEIAELETDENGKAKTTLGYTHKDIGKIFEYTITEVDTKKENVTYSDAQYVIRVEITLDALANTLVPVITVNEKAATQIVAEFENVYDYTPPTPPQEEPPKEEAPKEETPTVEPPAKDTPAQNTSPKTGDTNPICWIAVLFVSGAGAIGATKLRRKISS